MRRMLATARFTHSFFRPAAKLRLPSGGSLFHVKHGTRKCWDLVFGGMTWLARVPTGLFVEARELPKADAPTGASGLHRFGSLGVGAKGTVVAPRKRNGCGIEVPRFECPAPFARPA